ncbi:MAG: nucleotidyltransferase family protein, partial [Hyphomicrobium sp.]
EGRWRFVVNDHAHDGLSTSIRAGLAALAPDTSGVLIVLADMPGVSEDLIARVLDAASAGTTRIVHPVTADGQQGHPVFWPSDLFAELMSLQGDAGAKSILARHKHRVVTISPGAADAFSDIDTPGDLAAFVAGRNRDT